MAIKLQEEFGDALQVIFVESQGHGAEEIERYGLERKWFGGKALWTSERPVRNTSSGLPSFVLLDVDGRPILEGSSIRLASQMEEAIAAEVQKIRRGPEDAPKDLKDAARDLLRGRFGSAATEAEKLIQKTEDAELAAAARALAADASGRASASAARIGRLIDEGSYLRAEDLLDEFEKAVDGSDALEALVEPLRDRLEDDALEEERKAEKALRKLESVLFAKGDDAVPPRALTKLAEKHAGTKAAARASHLAGLLADG
ncbi:MAG: hypothetical protein O2865_02865 [Planctomycetota bacterium]|nr:hypothetical protein [Planctomycetota bacterium]